MMNQTQLAETLRIETTNGSAVPVFVAGNSLPSRWQQSLPTQQSSLIIHLMTGDSNQAVENPTLGRWQVSGIPAEYQGTKHIYLEILVSQAGSVEVRATHEGKSLTVTLMSETKPKAPIQSTDRISLNSDAPSPEQAKSPRGPLLDDAKKLEQLIQQIRTEGPGGLNETTLAQLREHGFEIGSSEESSQKPSFLGSLLNRGKKKRARGLTPEEIVRLAGDPLPPEERQRCPHCEAVVSRTAKKCNWCGGKL